MAKRVDQRQDATQEISGSQLLPNTPRPQVPRGNPQHDASMWMQTVVGSDDFAPAPKKRAAGGRRPWLVPLLVVGVLGAGAAGYLLTARSTSTTPTAATIPQPTTPTPAPMAVAAPAAAPSAPATPPVVSVPTDAGLVAPTSPALVVDAVSSVGAPIKKTTKKKVTKKKVTTKKPVPKRR